MMSMVKGFIRYLLFPTILLFGTGAMYWAIYKGWDVTWLPIAIVLSTMFIVYLAERILPFREDWNRSRGDLSADISSLFVIVAIMEPLLKLLGVWLLSLLLVYLGGYNVLAIFPSDAPLLLQLLIFAVMAEFGRYWMHRWSHNIDLLWRFHASHHSAERIYQFNGYRIHPLNFAWNYFFGQLPLSLLGAGSDVILLYFIFSTVVAAFQHANIDSKNGLLNYFFSTNELHRWHHTTDKSVGYKNHGSVLIVWDVLFGSFFDGKQRQLEEVGLSTPRHYPVNNFFRQLFVPFCWRRCVLDGK